jgi:hypothetical protein
MTTTTTTSDRPAQDKPIRFSDAKRHARNHSCKLSRDEAGDYVLQPIGLPEACAYYSTDLDDVMSTMLRSVQLEAFHVHRLIQPGNVIGERLAIRWTHAAARAVCAANPGEVLGILEGGAIINAYRFEPVL